MKIKIIKRSDIQRCPIRSLSPAHYRADGTCLCLCDCMTEDPGDGYGERVVTHSLTCPLHPEHDEKLS